MMLSRNLHDDLSTRPDPIAGSIADPQSLNRFAYVRNNPVA